MQPYQPHSFSVSDFQAVPCDNVPLYSWIWNAPVTAEETKRQIDAMREMGIRAFYIIPEPKQFRPDTMVTRLEPDYLSEDFFRELRYALEYARSLGMTPWLYDEGGWPSGNACGRVIEDHPEFRQFSLERASCVLECGEILTDAVREDGSFTAAAFREGKRLTLPYTAAERVTVERYDARPGNRADLLNPDAVSRFIRLTHDAYARAFDGDLSPYRCFFTDEPHVPSDPYVDPAAFETRYGYDYRDDLPRMMGDGFCAERRDYCSFYSELAAENYYGRLQTYCRQHGIRSAGHINDDHDPSAYRTHGGHLLRYLRRLDLPGIDVIWKQITWDGASSRLIFPHFAASAAHQNGGTYALSESFAVYGNALSFAQMRYCLYFQAVRGINLFNMMCSSYGNGAFEALQERPSFRPEIPSGFAMKAFNDFIGRLSYVASYGEADVHCALFYPIRDLWQNKGQSECADHFEKMGAELDAALVPYDIIDSDFLAVCVLKDASDGKPAFLSLENAKYHTVFLPRNASLTEEEQALLAEFESGGGQIFRESNALFAAVQTDGKAEGLRLTKRTSENGNLYLLYNEGTETIETRVSFPEDKPGYRLELETGAVYSAGTRELLSLESGQGCAFLFTQEDLPVQKPVKTGKKLAELSIASAAKCAEFRITADGIRLDAVHDAETPCGSGVFAELFGENFAGEAFFSIPLPERTQSCVLDLGRVEQCCQLFLNGKPLGVKALPPYRFVIPAGKAGRLSVKVGSTAGAAIVGFDVDRFFTKAQIGPYHERSRAFEMENRCGGLYGPVTLWEKESCENSILVPEMSQ